jgi:hypothetical protein
MLLLLLLLLLLVVIADAVVAKASPGDTHHPVNTSVDR